MRKWLTFGVILGLGISTAFGFRTYKPPMLTDLADPIQIVQLNNSLENLWDITNGRYNINIVTTNPDGNTQGDVGDILLYNNSGTYYLAINTTGAKVWRSVQLTDTP